MRLCVYGIPQAQPGSVTDGCLSLAGTSASHAELHTTSNTHGQIKIKSSLKKCRVQLYNEAPVCVMLHNLLYKKYKPRILIRFLKIKIIFDLDYCLAVHFKNKSLHLFYLFFLNWKLFLSNLYLFIHISALSRSLVFFNQIVLLFQDGAKDQKYICQIKYKTTLS